MSNIEEKKKLINLSRMLVISEETIYLGDRIALDQKDKEFDEIINDLIELDQINKKRELNKLKRSITKQYNFVCVHYKKLKNGTFRKSVYMFEVHSTNIVEARAKVKEYMFKTYTDEVLYVLSNAYKGSINKCNKKLPENTKKLKHILLK